MNILEEADNIVNKRSQEKQRQYGDFSKSMEKSAKLASLLINKEITTVDMFNCLIALKLSREAYSHKEDNLLDMVAYIAGLNNYLEKEKP